MRSYSEVLVILSKWRRSWNKEKYNSLGNSIGNLSKRTWKVFKKERKKGNYFSNNLVLESERLRKKIIHI